MKSRFIEKLPFVDTFIFALDGVITSGQIFFSEEYAIIESVNHKDIWALKTALENGYTIFIITERNSGSLLKMLSDKGAEILTANNKIALKELLLQRKLQMETSLIMISDNDLLELSNLPGIICGPKDASPDVISASDYISNFKGGTGCARDVLEKVMKVQGKW